MTSGDSAGGGRGRGSGRDQAVTLLNKGGGVRAAPLVVFTRVLRGTDVGADRAKN